MDEENALAEIHDAPPSLAKFNQDNPVGRMLEAVVKGGITEQNVAALDKMTDLYLRVEAENARKSFARAFMELQETMPKVIKTRDVKQGAKTMFTFADLEGIVDQVAPHLKRHGFAVSFSMEADDKRVIAVCHLMHVEGHTEERRYAVRIGQSLHNGNNAQNDAATSTYAKKGALCAALNVITTDDRNVKMEGEFITGEQAEELERRVRASGRDVGRVLKFADAPDFAHVRQAKYLAVDEYLTTIEKRIADEKQQHAGRPKPAEAPQPAQSSAINDAKREALDWSENTPESLILEALGSNASSAVVTAKAQAKAAGPMEAADSGTLRKIAYFWKLNQLTAPKK